MPDCPRCHQPIDAQAIACPYCRTSLKAFGHPGIPLHRAEGEAYLCQSCAYDADDSCNFPQRPHARECTLFVDRHQPLVTQTYRPRFSLGSWLQRHAAWLVVVGLVVVSLVVAL